MNPRLEWHLCSFNQDLLNQALKAQEYHKKTLTLIKAQQIFHSVTGENHHRFP